MDQQRLRELLQYDPQTGVFKWLATHRVGKVAGAPCKGYVVIKIEQKKYYAHKLAWLFVFGYIPKILDHINLDKSDNRIANLRVADHASNLANSRVRRHNQTGIKGVGTTRNGRYRALISFKGKSYHLGTFDTAEEAHEVYTKKAAELYGAFARSK